MATLKLKLKASSLPLLAIATDVAPLPNVGFRSIAEVNPRIPLSQDGSKRTARESVQRLSPS
jgi:hypothetical protein